MSLNAFCRVLKCACRHRQMNRSQRRQSHRLMAAKSTAVFCQTLCENAPHFGNAGRLNEVI